MKEQPKDRTTIGVPKDVRVKVNKAAALEGKPVYKWIEGKAEETIKKHIKK